MRLKNNKGFTLIELIVVIAIIAILAAVVIPNLFGVTEKAKQATTKALASSLVAGATGYWGNQVGIGMMVYPTNNCLGAAAVVPDAIEDPGPDGDRAAYIDNEAAIGVAQGTNAANARAIAAQVESVSDEWTCAEAGENVIWTMAQDASYEVYYTRPNLEIETYLIAYRFDADATTPQAAVIAGGTGTPVADFTAVGF